MSYPRITSFRSRRGSLSPARQRLWDRLWPQLGREVAQIPLNTAAWFGRRAPLIVEIGTGTGTTTAAMAVAEPHSDVVGIDVYQPGLAALLQRIEADGITNIRLLRGDAVDALEYMFSENSLAGVRVFFPDPWPKLRHHKRRLLQPATMALIANRLQPGAVVHVATDHAGYAAHIAAVGATQPQLVGLSEATGGSLRQGRERAAISIDRPVTKFERKAHHAGSAITELVWGKINS